MTVCREGACKRLPVLLLFFYLHLRMFVLCSASEALEGSTRFLTLRCASSQTKTRRTVFHNKTFVYCCCLLIRLFVFESSWSNQQVLLFRICSYYY